MTTENVIVENDGLTIYGLAYDVLDYLKDTLCTIINSEDTSAMMSVDMEQVINAFEKLKEIDDQFCVMNFGFEHNYITIKRMVEEQ